jgi:hypothetical protein
VLLGVSHTKLGLERCRVCCVLRAQQGRTTQDNLGGEMQRVAKEERGGGGKTQDTICMFGGGGVECR